MGVTIALGGDTMLGRGVGEVITEAGPYGLFAEEVRAAFREADLAVLNLECCVSDRGRRWAAPGKPFHFRAPPEAVSVLTDLGVDCVTLANNHALDYGHDALVDTLEHLAKAGIAVVGAGRDREEAREPAVLERAGTRVAVIGVTDHPDDFAATETGPGVAYAPLSGGVVPPWLTNRIEQAAAGCDVVLVTPHWGPNMTTEPLSYVREAAERFADAGATVVAGHSAHVFHGVNRNVLYDLGDLIDDYARDEWLRNDLGLAWRVLIEDAGVRAAALPLRLDYARTEPAGEKDREWIRSRLTSACAEFSTEVTERDQWLVMSAKG